jgi:hypothetical protein
LPFCPGSSCPGGQGIRRVNRVKRLGWSPVLPGKLARNPERTVPKMQKPLRGDAEILCTEGRKFSKSRPQGPPQRFASKTSSGVAAGKFGGRFKIFWSENDRMLVGIVSVGCPSERLGTSCGIGLGRHPTEDPPDVSRVLARGNDQAVLIPGGNQELIPGRFLERFSVGLHTRALWGRWQPAIPSRVSAAYHRPSMGRPNTNRSRPSRRAKRSHSGSSSVSTHCHFLADFRGIPVEILIRRSVSTE